MTTANAIEAMTDAGEFEILATRVLRQVDLDYTRLEHMGVNADGKTIKNPIDGFSKVPGTTPSKYVMAAFSTDQADKIERKLLFDHTQSEGKSYKNSDDGDLVKASRLAERIRKQEPDAKFIFTFCTNKQPSDELMRSGYAAGKAKGIEVRFLARSKIRDHLDTTPNGQWLRKKHLGVDTDMLSIYLLRELAENSVQQYSGELFCSDAQIIETATTKRLTAVALRNHPSVNIFVGESGSGKSVACYRLLSNIISDEGIALWLPAEVFEHSLSLEAGITSALKLLCSTLGAEAGREAMVLAATHNIPLVLVVDDINRIANPTRLAQNLISWYRRLAAGQGTNGPATTMHHLPHLIVPVWNHYWSSISSKYHDDRNIRELVSQPMGEEEALECIQACSKESLDMQSATELVRRLEHDPILIGLWSRLYDEQPFEHLDVNANTLIEAYIDRSIKEDSSSSSFLPADIRVALNALTARMLKERELYPEWSRILEWLNKDQRDVIRHISISGKICRVVHRGAIDRFEFRHDRLLETALADPLRECLSDIDANRDIVSDPFFSDFMARTVARIGDPELISQLIDCAPLVVLNLIRHLTDTETEFTKAVVDSARQWLVDVTADKSIPSEVIVTASRLLETIQNPLVLAITEKVKDNRQFAGARLLNGDAVHGKHFVSSHLFYPSMRFLYIENLIKNALQQNRDFLCQQVADDLNNVQASPFELRSALILAGYFGDCSLAVPVLTAWKKVKGCLVESLWASLRCSDKPETTLEPLLDIWATLSEPERDQIFSSLQFSMHHGLRDCVIELLVSRATQDTGLRGCILGLLREIDHPIAVGYVAAEIAQIEKRAEKNDGFSFWVMRCRDKWDPTRGSLGTRLTDESRNAIFESWQKAKEDWLRDSLLYTWIRTTDSVEELRSLPEEFLSSEEALFRRARLGDKTTTDAILAFLETKPNWWECVSMIWNNQFIPALEEAIQKVSEETPTDFSRGTTDNHYFLANLLRDIPEETAARLLLNHWEGLKYSKLFIQCALYIGGDELLKSVASTLEDAPLEWKPFEFIGSMFGFTYAGLKDRIADKHIDALLPYVQQLSDIDLMEVGKWLVENGRKKNFNHYMRGEINRRMEVQRNDGEDSYVIRLNRVYFPDDSDLFDALTNAENNENLTWAWCSHATDRGDTPDRIRGILQKWFLAQTSPQRLKIVANIVLELGQREDVAKLEEYQNCYGDDSTKLIVKGVSFAVRYRSLS